MTEEEEFTAEERRALDSWRAPEPPADFADRVLAADAARTATTRSARRVPVGVFAACAAAAVVLAVVTSVLFDAESKGTRRASARSTVMIGKRATVVSEEKTELAWSVARGGAAEVTQSQGNAFYRVEAGG